MNMKTSVIVLAGCAMIGTTAIADLMWDEAIDGDLSSDYLNPTQLFTKGGENHVIFTTIGAAENGGNHLSVFYFLPGKLRSLYHIYPHVEWLYINLQ